MKITGWDIYGAIGLVACAYTIYLFRKLKQRAKSKDSTDGATDEDGRHEEHGKQ
jgi:hypothetical protein